MRISDWSSDVCSSDLLDIAGNFLCHVSLFCWGRARNRAIARRSSLAVQPDADGILPHGFSEAVAWKLAPIAHRPRRGNTCRRGWRYALTLEAPKANGRRG